MRFRLRPLSFFLAIFCGSFAGIAIYITLAAMPASNNSRDSPTTTARTAIKSFNQAIELYRLDVGDSPPDLHELLKQPSPSPNSTGWRGPYLSHEKLPLDPWRSEYQYERLNANTGNYRVWSNGPDRLSNTNDDISKP